MQASPEAKEIEDVYAKATEMLMYNVWHFDWAGCRLILTSGHDSSSDFFSCVKYLSRIVRCKKHLTWIVKETFDYLLSPLDVQICLFFKDDGRC